MVYERHLFLYVYLFIVFHSIHSASYSLTLYFIVGLCVCLFVFSETVGLGSIKLSNFILNCKCYREISEYKAKYTHIQSNGIFERGLVHLPEYYCIFQEIFAYLLGLNNYIYLYI